ncbi:MAG: lasso peptide biosynthesis B2 protein [Burkholderiales bacterium]|nr:lasso peptide biosynthesis B2 protein [Burkholderiales bacterium]
MTHVRMRFLAVAMMLAAPVRKAKNFLRRPWFEKAWSTPAWFLLGASRLVILFVPFRRLAPFLGAQSYPWVPCATAEGEARALSIARVIVMAARHTPWESNCFAQAVTARILLGLYDVPYSLFFGIANDSMMEMKAHAWVVAGRVRVTGGESFGQFTVVGCFVASVLANA